MTTLIVFVVVATLLLGGLGIVASAPSWPLAPDTLALFGVYGLALVAAMGLVVLLVVIVAQQRHQQQTLIESLAGQQRQQRSLETAQLMERFVHQAEMLLAKDSLDPNKRSVQRCLGLDALRGNSGRGDPNYHRLARLFEWLADTADEARNDPAQYRLIEPILRQYAEIADQLCRVGEVQAERLAPLLQFQPSPPAIADESAL
ncbi:hypothetical protein [Halomonas sp. IOP_31]|uniref:hypothetical protein n=1 Tax=Halomonas sp. IOP_31 TaxID=2876584 RepID=UPI001E41B921|nr:hypothetical protein [Halomonas sp. IOP_31]MCD6007477.1 hypothetical protein [Halomonas sp. IOP_31]